MLIFSFLLLAARDAELNQLKALVEQLAEKVNARGDTPVERLAAVVGDSPRGPLKQRGNPHLKPATKPKHAKPNHAGT
jgi:hypothetical protein